MAIQSKTGEMSGSTGQGGKGRRHGISHVARHDAGRRLPNAGREMAIAGRAEPSRSAAMREHDTLPSPLNAPVPSGRDAGAAGWLADLSRTGATLRLRCHRQP